ncbi:hypothetical protein D9M68_539720 [compost metagenome]
MTMPHERTRAIIQTHDFLQQLEQDASVGEETRSMATQLLRHYPTRSEVLLQGMFEETLPVNLRISPFFSSTQASPSSSSRSSQSVWNRLCSGLAKILLSSLR